MEIRETAEIFAKFLCVELRNSAQGDGQVYGFSRGRNLVIIVEGSGKFSISSNTLDYEGHVSAIESTFEIPDKSGKLAIFLRDGSKLTIRKDGGESPNPSNPRWKLCKR